VFLSSGEIGTVPVVLVFDVVTTDNFLFRRAITGRVGLRASIKPLLSYISGATINSDNNGIENTQTIMYINRKYKHRFKHTRRQKYVDCEGLKV